MRQARLGLGLVEALERGQLAFTQVLQAAVIALVQLGLAAQLLALAAAYLKTRTSLLDPRQAVVLAQAHEHLAEFDLLAFVDQQLADLAADIERQPRTATGFQGAGAGIGDQGFHRAALHRDQLHGHRLGSLPPPYNRQ